jgi:hypothetical protein
MQSNGVCEMDPHEREDILATLRDELQEFFQWMLEELGEEYFAEDGSSTRFSWEDHVDKRIKERFSAKRAQLWERDLYAAFEHPKRPSIYEVMKADDLEILHYYQDELYCEHFKTEGFDEGSGGNQDVKNRYDESFSVILASVSLGYMYRLDLCEVCGLIEIWSMLYDSSEISLLLN